MLQPKDSQTDLSVQRPLGHIDMLEADKSVLAPAADKDQQVLNRAVTATAVPSIPPQLQVQDLQPRQESVSSCSQGLLRQKIGLVEKEELLTDHEAAAEVRKHSSCKEQVQQPAEGQSAESIR